MLSIDARNDGRKLGSEEISFFWLTIHSKNSPKVGINKQRNRVASFPENLNGRTIKQITIALIKLNPVSI